MTDIVVMPAREARGDAGDERHRFFRMPGGWRLSRHRYVDYKSGEQTAQGALLSGCIGAFR